MKNKEIDPRDTAQLKMIERESTEAWRESVWTVTYMWPALGRGWHWQITTIWASGMFSSLSKLWRLVYIKEPNKKT